MPSPFPGMDPYLEAQEIWPDFHDALAAEIRSELNRALPKPYYARLEMRPEIGIVEQRLARRRIVPDVAVVRPPGGRTGNGGTALLEGPRVDISRSFEVEVRSEPLRHHFVEIRDSRREHKLISLIEILSPSNKRRGPDRDTYEQKQRDVLQSDASLIELDLLRAGDRIYPTLDLAAAIAELEPQPDYLVLVGRSWRRLGDMMGYQVFPFGLREWLPCIPVPLRRGEDEVPLDLQFVFNRAYDGGPYRRGAVNYDEPPNPPLSEPDARWAEQLLGDEGRGAPPAP